MKYLLLVYGEEEKLSQVDDLHCLAFDKSIRGDPDRGEDSAGAGRQHRGQAGAADSGGAQCASTCIVER